MELADGARLTTRAVLIATGVAYRTLDVASLDEFHGVGVHYGSAMSEARALTDHDVCVAGGGNSADQAAMHLAQFARSVTMIVRSGTLAVSMSDYLVKSIERTPNIDIRFETEIVGGGGDGRLEWIDLEDRTTRTIERVAAAALFVLIGAEPRTAWLSPSVQRDAWGYIATGGHCECHLELGGERGPLMFETTMPGSSLSAMYDRAPSSAWRPRPAKERSASASSTTTSRNVELRGRSTEVQGDDLDGDDESDERVDGHQGVPPTKSVRCRQRSFSQ